MDIEIFKRDLQRIHLSDEARQRLVRTVNKTQANESRILPTKRHFFRPALLTGVLLFLLVGTVLFLLLPDLLDRSGLSGCPPEFADRYYSLIEIDSTAYIFQGNGTLYQMESDNSLQKIGRLRTDKILSDGDKIFYTRGNKVYQSGTDLSDRSLVFQEQQPIELDYITDNVILYHF